MPLLFDKHCCYIFGSLAWTVCFVAYVFAFAIPTWQSTLDSTGVITYGGLWQHTCTNMAMDCQSYSVIVDEPFLQASRSLACAALSIYCIAALLIFMHNCTVYGKNVQTENGIVSYLPVVSGILGVATCVLYLFFIHVEGNSDLTVKLEWGLVVSCVANCCCCLGGFCMLIGSCMERRRVVRETELDQNRTTLPGQPPPGHPIARVPVQENQESPLWTSLPTSSSNRPMALVAVPVSLLTQPSPHPSLSSSGSQEHLQETGYTVQDVPSDVARAAPSAPPPEHFYY